jgi:hypothetical protein
VGEDSGDRNPDEDGNGLDENPFQSNKRMTRSPPLKDSVMKRTENNEVRGADAMREFLAHSNLQGSPPLQYRAPLDIGTAVDEHLEFRAKEPPRRENDLEEKEAARFEEEAARESRDKGGVSRVFWRMMPVATQRRQFR